MSFDFRLPVGNEARIGKTTLRSNGRVDRQESLVPKTGITNIEDTRVEEFIRTLDAKELGKGWRAHATPDEETGIYNAVISGNFGETKPTIASQFLHVDPKAHEVTVQTQGGGKEFFNHWIQASYDPSSSQVNPKTIVEWVSS